MASAPRTATGERRTMGLVVLVTDDDEARALYGDHLRSLGFTVFAERDGEDALRLLYANQPRVLVTDIVLPSIDGIKLCRKARQLHSDKLAIIVLSPLEDVSMVELCMDAGANDYLLRNGDLDEFASRVSYWGKAETRRRQFKDRERAVSSLKAALEGPGARKRRRGGFLSSDSDPDLADMVGFIRKARHMAGAEFGRSVEEKLYLIGYVSGVIKSWGNRIPHIKAASADYLKAVLTETSILAEDEISMMVAAMADLQRDRTFARAVGTGTRDSLAGVAVGETFVPLGLSQFARRHSDAGREQLRETGRRVLKRA